jgi:hypothetical protein
MAQSWAIPDGVRIGEDGGWTVGGFDILHRPSLRYLKARLVFEDGGAWLVEGARRLAVSVDGPAFEVASLRLDRAAGRAWAELDDGSEEEIAPDALWLNEETSRIECLVRDGRARALLSRGAHQTLLGLIERDQDRFFVRVGRRLIPVRT